MGEKLVTAPIEPIKVAIIGTGDGGLPANGTIASTPGAHNPNIVIKIVNPLLGLGVRFFYAYISNLFGLITAAMTSTAIPYTDFKQLFFKCAGLALAGAVVLSLKNILTVFAGLEQKFPLSTGSV